MTRGMARDPNHWLFRLTAPEWMAAAQNELARAREALERADKRKGLFEARRAAGMALNALLVEVPRDAYGRSYMDHLGALAADAAAPDEARRAAAVLLEKPRGEAVSLVGLRGLPGTLDLAPIEAALQVLSYVASTLESSRATHE